MPCGLQTIAESSHSFASTPRPACAVLLRSACQAEGETQSRRRSGPSFPATSTQKRSDLLPSARLRHTPRSTRFPSAPRGYRGLACMRPYIGLFPKSPEITGAVQNVNTSLCATLLTTDVALAKVLLSRGCLTFVRLGTASYKELSVVLH